MNCSCQAVPLGVHVRLSSWRPPWRPLKYNSLTPSQQVVFLTITAYTNVLELNLSNFMVPDMGITIAGAPGGLDNSIQKNTELNLVPNTAVPTAVASLQAGLNSNSFTSNSSNFLVGISHPGFNNNYRQNVSTNSLQVNFNSSNGAVQLAIDPFNPAGALGFGVIPTSLGKCFQISLLVTTPITIK